MEVLPLHKEVTEYLRNHQLGRKFSKQIQLVKENIFHPSLNLELLEPRHLHLYSLRIDRKYRAIFIFLQADQIEVIEVNNHYQ